MGGEAGSVQGGAVFRSPYRRHGRHTQSVASVVVHVCAWAVAVIWLAVEVATRDGDRVVPTLVMLSAAFVAAAPEFVARWEREFQALQADVESDHFRLNIQRVVARTVRFRNVIVLLPCILIAIAYIVGDARFADRLGLPRDGVAWVVGFVVLQLGAAAAGWGTLAAICTISIIIDLAQAPSDFSPFAGTVSRTADRAAEFCFTAALMFGTAGAVLLPGLVASTWVARGAAQFALGVTVAMVVLNTIALLAVPATMLSRRSERERARYLDDLSGRIEELTALAADPSRQFQPDDYARLRALLEVRAHLVESTLGVSSVELVKRIPITVIFPVASLAASWLSLIQTR